MTSKETLGITRMAEAAARPTPKAMGTLSAKSTSMEPNKTAVSKASRWPPPPRCPAGAIEQGPQAGCEVQGDVGAGQRDNRVDHALGELKHG